MRAGRLLALGAIALPVSLSAQNEVQRSCDARFLPAPASVSETIRPSHPDVAFAAMAERIATERWVFLVDSVRQAVLADPWMESAERQTFLEQLRLTREELVRAQGAGGNRVTTTRFDIAQPTGGAGPEEYDLFIRFTPLPLAPLAPESRRAVCWTALAMRRMLTVYGAPKREAATRSLNASVKRWDNYGTKGYSQFPWELALNSAGYSASSYDPPRTQKVLLHPALGLELAGPRVESFGDLADLRSNDVVTLEPLGYLVYNDSRSFYYGASTMVTLGGDRRIGGGGLLHLGQAIKAGYVWRGRDETGKRGQSVILSADLYQFLVDTPKKLKEWRAKALAQGVAALAPKE